MTTLHPEAGRRLRLFGGLAAVLAAAPLGAQQQVRIVELTRAERDVPVRLVGYGLVVGLDGTGDRAAGAYGARHTVQSVVNLLRNFDIDVPAQMLRTRNVAAVLVTAEVSPYLRAGGNFDVQVASLGDAVSLRGGMLWLTPLVPDAGEAAVATAQGGLVLSEGVAVSRVPYAVETSARIPGGGLFERELPRPGFTAATRLLLREPDVATAARIVAAINQEFGAGAARVEDPGAVALEPPGQAADDPATFLARVGELTVEPLQRARLLIDGRDGTIVAGGDLPVGAALVSHGGMTLTIGGAGTDGTAGADGLAGADAPPGRIRVEPGASVQDIASALHAVGATPPEIAAVFDALRRVGALAAEVLTR